MGAVKEMYHDQQMAQLVENEIDYDWEDYTKTAEYAFYQSTEWQLRVISETAMSALLVDNDRGRCLELLSEALVLQDVLFPIPTPITS